MKTIKPFALSAAVICCLLLSACQTVPSETRLARYPEATDMRPCPPLEKPSDGTLASLYRYGVSAAHQYHDCRAHHDSLVEWVKRGQAAQAAE